ncbi:uncharacterized protein Z519_09684 [Cladophialophora bantiana CBS 173.52]|uniref:Uncharacterized protein n=1 Tax=Cladophialophora bantiana (strain ATCC 10958 / CBS 173.52 / CDC B-1940 / NIH 8579) TaxID=1442370 RepID=A0A0D2H8I4_CLAB1|nr:uncharacterized protein Z519_09684 [Cladophialophora bantiana CBS 173.52]KIW89528.1 hypothetical protein Z519_09684 [Cladophialophora bantiana CBS 173.52]
MAPPEHPFPVSELDQRVRSHTVNYKERSRKLPQDFDLKRDCELMELVQYSCTTVKQQYERALASETGTTRMECFPIVRLFRKCVKGGKVFHVETTAWEGQHAWKPPANPQPTVHGEAKPSESESSANLFTTYWSSLWPKK